jgi:hypothetical protein
MLEIDRGVTAPDLFLQLLSRDQLPTLGCEHRKDTKGLRA